MAKITSSNNNAPCVSPIYLSQIVNSSTWWTFSKKNAKLYRMFNLPCYKMVAIFVVGDIFLGFAFCPHGGWKSLPIMYFWKSGENRHVNILVAIDDEHLHPYLWTALVDEIYTRKTWHSYLHWYQFAWVAIWRYLIINIITLDELNCKNELWQ